MFSGITQGLYPITQVAPGDVVRYAVALPASMRDGLQVGASVSVDGVCQTVVAIEGDDVFFEAMPATCDITTLGGLKTGDLVSIERSMRMGDECGGHLLSGHVRGTAEVLRCEQQSGQVCLQLQCPPVWCDYLLPKGYVALNGSSLTIADITDAGLLTVYLIPETCRLTRLGQLASGDRVHVELDQQTCTIVQTVHRVMARASEK